MTHLDAALRTSLQEIPSVSDALDQRWAEAACDELGFGYGQEEFAAVVAAKLTAGVLLPESLAGLHVRDLYIAAACASGDSEALRYMEENIFSKLPPALVRAGNGAEDVDDILQTLREKLFVGTREADAKIRSYNGQGKLFSWARIAAIRILQNRARGSHREVAVDSDELWERLLPPGDAQLEYLKERYRGSFRTALAAAVGALDDRERVLLRQHIVEGVPSTQLGALYQVHRATVSRWIVAAQEALLTATRAHLMKDLQVSTEELESVLRLIQSQFETGIGDLLGDSSK